MANKTTKRRPAKKSNGKLSVPTKEVLTLAEAAAFLRVSEDGLKSEALQGQAPGQLIAGNWRFSRSALMNWLGESKSRLSFTGNALDFKETPEEFEAFLKNIENMRDEVDRATGHGKYATE